MHRSIPCTIHFFLQPPPPPSLQALASMAVASRALVALALVACLAGTLATPADSDRDGVPNGYGCACSLWP